MIKTTFDLLWKKGLENDAKNLGVIDGDLGTVRAKVKNLFVSAGWAEPDGTASFVSDLDFANALQAARAELNKVAPFIAATRKVEAIRASAGGSPTKSQVVAGKSLSASAEVTLQSTGNLVTAATFAPKMGQVGDKCPRCNSQMDPVMLANKQPAIYCVRDRVVTPLPRQA